VKKQKREKVDAREIQTLKDSNFPLAGIRISLLPKTICLFVFICPLVHLLRLKEKYCWFLQYGQTQVKQIVE
jgi:hypothetical protein